MCAGRSTPIRAGRVARPATLLRFGDNTCELQSFPLPPGGGAARPADPYPNLGGLPVSDRILRLIRGEHDDEHPYESRSEAVMAVLVAMAGAGCTDDQMSDVMLTMPIGEHVREQEGVGSPIARRTPGSVG